MKYRNATALLPKELLAELQKYCDGELIYVPSRRRKAGWGTVNGSRERYAQRNLQLIHCYKSGATIEQIASQFYLSEDSIRKIIRSYQANQA